MSKSALKTLDSELLLQELRARESRNETAPKTTFKSTCCDTPFAKVDAKGLPQLNVELEKFETKDIVVAMRNAEKVIYGTDDRKDLYNVSDPLILRDAESVVALIHSGDLTDNGDGTSTIRTRNFGSAYNLCASEPFRNQPTAAFCTGFLVDPSFVATAAHCVDASSISTTRFVFGFQMASQNTATTRISNNEIYRGIRLTGRQLGTDGTDWAVVQLDRPVLNHPYVHIRRTGKIANSTSVHVIGHPCGLPKKYAPDAYVRENNHSRYFVANLDTYGGNSGSPVFNQNTHEVEGILVRGETDFVQNGSCNVSRVCPMTGCRGEDCTRTTEFDEIVPKNIHDFIPFNPARARVVRAGQRWKISVDGMWLLDFPNKSEARQALAIIKYYKMNLQCFVGRPYPSMEFYLINGSAPKGDKLCEDAIGFTPNNLEVQKIGGHWKIVEGNHWLMDFGQHQDEAWQSLSYILRYGFRYICFVGRPDPSMTYFRS